MQEIIAIILKGRGKPVHFRQLVFDTRKLLNEINRSHLIIVRLTIKYVRYLNERNTVNK